MASRISQMRNGMYPQTQQPPQSQPQLNDSIVRTRAMMAQVKNSQNPQAVLAQMLQNNPNTAAIANMLKNNGNLEAIAKQMAQTQGIDINQLISQLNGA